jgi:hypothetical protein
MENTANDEPQRSTCLKPNRPDLNRIHFWHGFNHMWTQEEMETMASYIEFLEQILRDNDIG